jgi:hypothetical protein
MKRAFTLKVERLDTTRYIHVMAYTPSQAKALARMQLSADEIAHAKLTLE